MTKKLSGEDVEQSSAYRSARGKADDYASSPDKLNDLLDRAARKARKRRGPLAEVWDMLMACLRLLRAYATGQYREIPSASLISIIAAVVYFVMPVDLIPDFLLAFGFIDDAALLAWIIGSVKADIENFLQWEAELTTLANETSPEDEKTR